MIRIAAIAFSLLFAASVQAKPNVILIVADDLGYGDVGCYGQKKIRTPSIDRLASEGMRFTQFYSGSPVCAPSRCCLMTGKHTGHAYIRDNKATPPEGQEPLSKEELMLPELMKREGYVTGAIGKWGLGMFGTEGDPLKRGIDFFFGYNCQGHAHNHYPRYLYRNDKRFDLEGNEGKATGKQFSHDLFEKETLAFVNANKDKPFFLFLPYIIPHLALQAPEDALAEYQGKWPETPYDGKKGGYQAHKTPRAAYAAMITRMDRTIGRLLDLLKELKLDDNTIVLFSSDNGAATQGYAGIDTDFFNSTGGLRAYKGDVYEGGIRVPLVVRWTGKIKAGSVSDHIAYFPDLLPTLLECVGETEKTPKGIDGLSFAPTLFGKEQKKHEFLYWEFPSYGQQQALRMGDWKGLRRNLNKGVIKTELYNLKDDVAEKKDVASEHPEIVKQIEAIMKAEHTPSKLFPLKAIDPAPKK
jgi:arylsulfatase